MAVKESAQNNSHTGLLNDQKCVDPMIPIFFVLLPGGSFSWF